ncbi:MAG: 2,3-bisphosphoglycerate-independent phosphoglycerate mutase [Methylococcales bacterium]|jgi:2,3-bisphosphoglycerate-independent phosphoglycerate mutase|nr:2,3-bisphosphoglycerate-independent phosphoglycerate mutase [Methylococcales bacterium]MBT7446046.1 2,3-bisphosphoglycerate-independent phosphoglycerate mutase [Methylococcales bacterium]
MSSYPKPVVLLIMDGWGYSEEVANNAILAAKTPVWDRLWKEHPHTLIRASGAEVGLPSGQMGNSEVGHMNIGAGRVVYQEFTRVSRSIKTGSFFNNHTLTDAVDCAISCNNAVHILGLLSDGGVHSHEEHIHAMVELAVKAGTKNVHVHAFLDGRDTAPQNAARSITLLEDKLVELGGGRITSIIGRFYAMDRDHRWPRVQAAYDLITQGIGEHTAKTAMEGLQAAYNRNETDEFVVATAIPTEEGPVRINDGDVVIFMNYRSDRARQITRPFIEPGFDGFERKHFPKLSKFVSLTEYKSTFDIPVAFPAERLQNVFGKYIANIGLRQLRIAETEKYAHVTFFFNGGIEDPFDGEDRVLVNSPDVQTYDLQPEMNAPDLTDKLVEAIESKTYDVIICNYANPDMVGHSGVFDATVKAIESLDFCLDRVLKAIHRAGGEIMITADHGNAELMKNEKTGQPHTAHTNNPVPFIYVGRDATLSETGALSDIAPSLLTALGLKIPEEITGRSLIQFTESNED